MDAILDNLGVEVVDEDVSQKRIVKNRVIKNLVFHDETFLPPDIADVPILSSGRFNALRNEIITEIKCSDSKHRDVSLLKFRYLDFLGHKFFSNLGSPISSSDEINMLLSTGKLESSDVSECSSELIASDCNRKLVDQTTTHFMRLRSRTLMAPEVHSLEMIHKDSRKRSCDDGTTYNNMRHRNKRKRVVKISDDVDVESDEDASTDDTTEDVVELETVRNRLTSDITGDVSGVEEAENDDWEDDAYARRVADARQRPAIQTTFGSAVDSTSWDRLHAHQRAGLEWLWTLYTDGTGGILGDEMGLGKTAQLCCHFDSVSRQVRAGSSGNLKARLLVVCPATVLFHWVKELRHWSPTLRVIVIHKLSNVFKNLELESKF